MNNQNKITDEILASMIEVFHESMYRNGTELDNRCCEDVYIALTELKQYRDVIKAHNEKKKAQVA